MMRESDVKSYAEGDGWQALALPYISPAVRMVFILPEADRFDAIEAGLDRTFLDGVTSGLSDHTVEMQIPKFSYESELELKPVLQSLGMELAFTEGEADLSGITQAPGEIWVDEVYHKAFVALDEQGTEAAAATAVVVRGRLRAATRELRARSPVLVPDPRQAHGSGVVPWARDRSNRAMIASRSYSTVGS